MTTHDPHAELPHLTAPERLAAIQEIVRRRDLSAARPLIKLLREDLGDDELTAVFAALELVGNRNLVPMLQTTARTRPALAERLTALHGHLTRPPEPNPDKELRWISVGGGRLAVGPRPKIKALATMRDAGTTDIVTLLSEPEGAREVGTAVKSAGLRWHWLALRNGDPPLASEYQAISNALDIWASRLDDGAALYIHCAAGIHRTGMLAHALLRRTGHSPESALQRLAELRSITAAETGPQRLEWGHRYAR